MAKLGRDLDLMKVRQSHLHIKYFGKQNPKVFPSEGNVHYSHDALHGDEDDEERGHPERPAGVPPGQQQPQQALEVQARVEGGVCLRGSAVRAQCEQQAMQHAAYTAILDLVAAVAQPDGCGGPVQRQHTRHRPPGTYTSQTQARAHHVQHCNINTKVSTVGG